MRIVAFLHEAFSAEQVCKLVRRLEFHTISRPVSWLNIAEIERAVAQPLDQDLLGREVEANVREHNMKATPSIGGLLRKRRSRNCPALGGVNKFV
jgi:hypothetical protein